LNTTAAFIDKGAMCANKASRQLCRINTPLSWIDRARHLDLALDVEQISVSRKRVRYGPIQGSGLFCMDNLAMQDDSLSVPKPPHPPSELATTARAVQPRNPLHGLTLEAIVTRLADFYGWDDLGQRIPIRCFTHEPSVGSSLKFLRKTPWAREKVESLYLFMLRDQKRQGF
jgi:DNA-binding protein VF530